MALMASIASKAISFTSSSSNNNSSNKKRIDNGPLAPSSLHLGPLFTSQQSRSAFSFSFHSSSSSSSPFSTPFLFASRTGNVGGASLIRAQGGVERSYVMVKPDGVQRGLVGEIISRFERKGFVLKGLKLFECPKELAEEHYKDLKSKPFFGKLVAYIISGPVVCMVWEGPGVVASARKLIGVTNPLQAEPGTIRGDLGIEVGRNVVHGSDSPENGEREIALWFKDGEVCEWTQTMTPWLRE